MATTTRVRATETHAEVFAPIHTVNAFEALVDRLGRAIKLGLLAPGERLPSERELSERVGLSRSTVREALQMLCEAGYLMQRRGAAGGTFVSGEQPGWSAAQADELLADPATVADFVAMRRCLELGAAELAAERADAAAISALAAVIEDAAEHERRDGYADYRRADSQFHICLARLSGSTRLVAELAALHELLGELLGHLPHSTEALVNSTSQHRRILGAVAERDAVAARAVMREHILGTEHLLQGLLPAPWIIDPSEPSEEDWLDAVDGLRARSSGW